MAAAMLSYWAGMSNQDLSSFVRANSTTLAALTGNTAASNLLGLSDSSLSPSSLNSVLNSSGAGFDVSSSSSLDSLLAQLQSKSGTIDGKFALDGVNTALSLGAHYSPTLLSAPISPDSALFGVFFDKSMASLISSQPNLFARVSSSGLGSAATNSAWAAAIASATKSTAQNLSVLPDQCGVTMLQAVASGSASSNGSCGSCAVAGTYLHSQLGKIFNPGTNSVLPTTGTNTTNSSSWSTMQGWLQQGALSQNQSLANQLNSASANSSATSCSGSSSATQGALSSVLPGVFSNLGR
jgi:hypothetical protein